MKRLIHPVLVGLVLLSAAAGALAQEPDAVQPDSPTYRVDWWSLDGGGAASQGGAFGMIGTLGQPDAGPAQTGGLYQFAGGFWAGGSSGTPEPGFRLYLPLTIAD